jgi:muramoyltetrapeptide carboxypeptidase
MIFLFVLIAFENDCSRCEDNAHLLGIFPVMKQTLPDFLKPGDTIGLSATARFATEAMIESATALLERAGFKVYHHPNILLQNGQVAGSILQRVHHFNDLIHHKEVKAIWNIRGGYGSAEIVDLVDWKYLQKHPKWLIGFSDFTTFLCHGVQKGLVTLHAPMPVSFGTTNPDALQATINVLMGEEDYCHSLINEGLHGQIIAGNLSVIYSIIGTPSLPNLNNSILILEDLDEYHYHLDRMLTSMQRRGDFEGLRAVVLSNFTDIHDHEIPWKSNFMETLAAPFLEEGIPVYNFPLIGHGRENWPILLRAL